MAVRPVQTIEKCRITDSNVIRTSISNRCELPVLLQGESTECGLACVAMVAAFHGKRYDMPQLRERFPPSSGGSTLLDLIRIADALELSSRAVKVELEDLHQIPAPAVLHWNMSHFVVLKRVSGNRILIVDPARGSLWISLPEASKCFTGVVLELSPVAGFSRTDERRVVNFSSLWSGITGFKRSASTLVALTLMMEAFVLAAPYYQQLVVDEVLVAGDPGLLKVIALGFSLILLLEVAAMSMRKLVLLSFNGSLSIQMGANVFRHLVRLPLSYFNRRSMGDVVTRFGSLNNIREVLTLGLMESMIDSLMVVGVLTMLFVYSPKLTAVMALAALAYILVRTLLLDPVREASRLELESRASESSAFMESVRGMQTIKLFSAEALRESVWRNLYIGVTNRIVRLGILDTISTGFNRLIFGIGTILTVYVAAGEVIAGDFTIGMLLAFLAYALIFVSKVSKLVDMYIKFKMVSLHLERLSDIVLTEREDKIMGSGRGPLKGGIALKGVSFSYGPERESVVENLSFNIAPGESIALVGRSGCGKTTIMKLMLGLIAPQQGEVLVDGVPLSRVDMTSYRNQIGSVMQDDTLFAGSIRENIAFFEPNVDIDRVYECARISKIYDYVSALPMGFNSLVGDMGTSLSGGQKQRILLARALYRRPRILFLDEATSHLDVATENSIGESIAALSITRIIVAHRRETIEKADRVIDVSTLRDNTLVLPQCTKNI